MKTFYLKILLLCAIVFVVNFSSVLAQGVDQKFDAIVQHIADGNYEKAIKEYQAVMKMEPSYSGLCYNGIGSCYMCLLKYQDAISAFEKALSFAKNKGEKADIYINIGDCYECLGKNDRAIKCYQEYINLLPDGPSAEFVLEKISYLQSGNTVSNNTNYSNNTDDLAQKGIDYYKDGNYEQAIPTLKEAIKKDPKSILARLYLAYCYYEQNLFDNAIPEYKKVIELDKNNFWSYACLGDIYMYKGDYQEAISYYIQARKVASDDTKKGDTDFYLGNCYLNSGNYKEAIQCYEKALVEIPEEPVTYYNLGQCYKNMGNGKKAIEYYKKYISVSPQGDYVTYAKEYISAIENGNITTSSLKTAEDYYNLGWKYSQEGQYDKSIEAYLEAIAIDPNHLNSYNNLGVIYLDIKGDYKQAAYFFQSTIEINPDYALGYYNIGATYYSLGKYKEAIPYYKRYLELDPKGTYAENAKKNIKDLEALASSNPTPVPTQVSSNPTPVPTKISSNLTPVPTQISSKSGPIIDIIEPASLLGKKNLVLEETNPVVTTVRLVGIVSDDEQVKKVTVNGQPVELSIPSAKGLEVVSADLTYKYQFTVPVGLTMGKNEIKVQAWDASNNMGESMVSINYNPEQKVANNTTNVGPIQKGEKWAVVIGIGNYQNKNINKLNYTVADARAIYEFLVSKAGFAPDHVKLLLNEDATQKNIKSALGTFLTRKAMKNDTVFIYYSGHGAPEPDPASTDGDGLSKYLVTYDADPEDLYSTAFPMEEIRKIFQKIEANKIVFFVDACYSGATGGRTFSKPGMKAGNVSEKFLDDLSAGEGRVVVTASSASEVSLEVAELGHGIFTYYLLQGLRGSADTNNDKRITIDEVYQYVYDNVLKESKNRGGNQHPMKKGETSGQFIIVNY